MICQTPKLPELTTIEIGNEKQRLIIIDDFLIDPALARQQAGLQKFAQINPYYPGIRSTYPEAETEQWRSALSPILSGIFETDCGQWCAENWFSIVTTPPTELAPIQRLPHVDGTDHRQIALMLYLHETSHGGTAFFRHKRSGYESLTPSRYPEYKKQLEQDVSSLGLPAAKYVGDGEPHFEIIHTVDAVYNRAVLYRGNCFHSGVINNQSPLPPDPFVGRLTVNAFFRPQS